MLPRPESKRPPTPLPPLPLQLQLRAHPLALRSVRSTTSSPTCSRSPLPLTYTIVDPAVMCPGNGVLPSVFSTIGADSAHEPAASEGAQTDGEDVDDDDDDDESRDGEPSMMWFVVAPLRDTARYSALPTRASSRSLPPPTSRSPSASKRRLRPAHRRGRHLRDRLLFI